MTGETETLTELRLVSDPVKDSAIDGRSGVNPLEVLKEAVEGVQDMLSSLSREFSFTFDDFTKFLCEKEPDLDARLTRLWNKVDSNVYGRYISETLSRTKMTKWRQDLEKWRGLFESALHLFVMRKFGQVVEKRVSMSDLVKTI